MRGAPTVLYFSDLSILGGGEVCLAALLRTLDRGRFRPVVVAPERGPLLEEVERLGARAHAIKLFEGMRAWRVKRYVYVHLHLRLRHNLARIRRMERGTLWLDASLPVPDTRAEVRARDFRGQAAGPRGAALCAVQAFVQETGILPAEALA